MKHPRPSPLALAWLLALTVGCRTTESTRPAAAAQPVIFHASAGRTWDVIDSGKTVGRVVHFESPEDPGRSLYMVSNVWEQDLGWVDHLGRAYRLLPHHRDPAWVGTGTVEQGVERILRVSGRCVLLERPLVERAAEVVPARAPLSDGFGGDPGEASSSSPPDG